MRLERHFPGGLREAQTAAPYAENANGQRSKPGRLQEEATRKQAGHPGPALLMRSVFQLILHSANTG